ncbi:hypothetical protein Pelo_15031 [Pelomyxa schiedti]|nr:hypothetical protein Pelo_15031 [Pelomyxa schiedti]
MGLGGSTQLQVDPNGADVDVDVDDLRWPSQRPIFSAVQHGSDTSWETKIKLWDESSRIIEGIIEQGDDAVTRDTTTANRTTKRVTAATMMPNPRSMRVYLEKMRTDKNSDYRALTGHYWSSWYAPSTRGNNRIYSGRMGQLMQDIPEEELPAIAADDDVINDGKQREKLEGVMKGFCMKRPAVPATQRYSYYIHIPSSNNHPQSASFLCGVHPRAGKDSPLSVLGIDVLRHILMLFGRFKCPESDGMHREPIHTDFERSFDMYYNKMLPSTKFALCAYGNFDADADKSDNALHALIYAYSIVYECGPWISLDDFVTVVEAGNVGTLRCFAFLKSGAYARTPQERFIAIRLHETLFGVLSYCEESKFLKCFTGDGLVLLANGSQKFARDIQIGDCVKTESGIKRVCRVERKTVNAEIPMSTVFGVWLTPGHPVFMNGTWTHPFEIAPVTTIFVTDLFNFELSGGPLSRDHSVWINGLLVCTLGKDCGNRIVGGWPRADDMAGTGYWRNGESNWSRSLSSLLSN